MRLLYLLLVLLVYIDEVNARTLDLSFTYGQRANTNLPDIPRRLLQGDLQFIPSWYWGAAVALPLWRGEHTAWQWDVENRLLKHTGGQQHLESALAFVVRTPCWSLLGLCLHGGVGEGISWAWEPPAEEIGRSGKLGEDTYQLQNYLLFEVAAGKSNQWQLLLQLHHRSGIYGLISPRRTGSNYLSIGIRRAVSFYNQ